MLVIRIFMVIRSIRLDCHGCNSDTRLKCDANTMSCDIIATMLLNNNVSLSISASLAPVKLCPSFLWKSSEYHADKTHVHHSTRTGILYSDRLSALCHFKCILLCCCRIFWRPVLIPSLSAIQHFDSHFRETLSKLC